MAVSSLVQLAASPSRKRAIEPDATHLGRNQKLFEFPYSQRCFQRGILAGVGVIGPVRRAISYMESWLMLYEAYI